MDHKSDFWCINLCIITTQEETLKSKTAFEKLANSHGVSIKSHHADNGKFTELGFRETVAEVMQIITFVEWILTTKIISLRYIFKK